MTVRGSARVGVAGAAAEPGVFLDGIDPGRFATSIREGAVERLGLPLTPVPDSVLRVGRKAVDG